MVSVEVIPWSGIQRLQLSTYSKREVNGGIKTNPCQTARQKE